MMEVALLHQFILKSEVILNYSFFNIHYSFICGWGGRIRTSECRNQSPVSYHLTTPHQGLVRIEATLVIRDYRKRFINDISQIGIHLDVAPDRLSCFAGFVGVRKKTEYGRSAA